MSRLSLMISILEFYGILFILMLYQKHNNDMLLCYYAIKRSIARRRARYVRMKKLMRQKRSKWIECGRTDAWWQNMINGLSPEQDWKRNFRISKELFQELCEKLRPYISPKDTPNYRYLSVEKKVCISH